MFQEMLSMAIYNLSKRKLRSFLTILGIIIGIGAVVSLISLGNSMTYSITEQLEQFGPNKIIVMPKMGESFGPTGFSEHLTDKDLEKIRDINGVKVAVPVLFKTLPVTFKGSTRTVYVLGLPPKESESFFSDIQSYEIESGRFIREGEKNTVVIGHLFKEDLYPEKMNLRDKITIKNVELKVVGIMKRIGNPQDDSQVYLSIDTLREIVNNPDEITMIMLEAEEDPSIVAKRIEDELNKLHGDELFTAMTTEQVQARIESIFGILSIVLVGIAAISLIVAGFGIMNTMLMSVLERTREIGIMKAVGASNRMIMLIFLVETATLGLIGGIAGIVFGEFISYGISKTAFNLGGITLPIVFSPMLLIQALVFSVFVGVFSGLYPAWRASRLNPVEALRYE